jgi:hypothetical protein
VSHSYSQFKMPIDPEQSEPSPVKRLPDLMLGSQDSILIVGGGEIKVNETMSVKTSSNRDDRLINSG